MDIWFSITAAAQIAYPIKFPNFPTKLIKYHSQLDWNIHVHRQSPGGGLVLRSCGTSQRIRYYFKVNLVNFLLFWYFLCIFPIKLMCAITLIPNMTTKLPLIRNLEINTKLIFFFIKVLFCNNFLIYGLILFIFFFQNHCFFTRWSEIYSFIMILSVVYFTLFPFLYCHCVLTKRNHTGKSWAAWCNYRRRWSRNYMNSEKSTLFSLLL